MKADYNYPFSCLWNTVVAGVEQLIADFIVKAANLFKIFLNSGRCVLEIMPGTFSAKKNFGFLSLSTRTYS